MEHVPAPELRAAIVHVLVPSETLTEPVGVAPRPVTATVYVTDEPGGLAGPLTVTAGVALATTSLVVPVAVV
jgi:hypothetical protein